LLDILASHQLPDIAFECLKTSLFAESLIADDDLRTPTLVVRDCANLAIALGAAGEMAADWWRQLAAKHAAPGAIINADTPVSEGALAATSPA
jgi:hypothetical protein